MRRFLALLLILPFLTLGCTAHIRVRPVSSPSVGVLCSFPRRYVAVQDTVTEAEVAALKAAIDATNALTPGLVVFAGFIPLEEARGHMAAGATVLVGMPDRYDVMDEAAVAANKGVLGWTGLSTDPQGCLKGMPIVLLADTATLPEAGQLSSLIHHEYMHSLGFDHASVHTAFRTLMKPSLGADAPAGFTAADKRAILSVYSRGMF